MAVVKTLPTHAIVQAAYPRTVTERDEVGMAVGKAIDTALSHMSHEFRESRRPTLAATHRLAAQTLDEELADADLRLTPEAREQELTRVAGVLQAFRRSEVMGLARPRSRMILINEQVGVYAQPDYWDGRARFYEMKSYRAVPIPPDVRLQVQLFQCAFPGFSAFLACFDRHSVPVTATIESIPPLGAAEMDEVLRLAHRTGIEIGTEKVLEYVDNPIVRYAIPT